MLTSEIQINEYDLLGCDRNRHGGGVACYIRNDLSYNVQSYFPKDIENIFFELLLSNTKPIAVVAIYCPPNQTNFIEIFNENLSKVDTNNVETYILGDFNINLWQNGHCFPKTQLAFMSIVPNDVKNYFDFCTMFGLKQLIQSPTLITCSSSSIIDHILTSFPDRVTQRGILNVRLSDHQLIYCRRKITRIKRGGLKQIKFCSFKNYTIDGYEKALVEINFPEYKNFDNMNDAYSNFIQKLMEVIDKVAPVKNKRIKGNSQEWFDSEISEELIIRDKLFKKYKKTRLHVDEEIYKRARYSVQNLIAKKKKEFFENRLKEFIGKPKELWKAIKSLGLPNKSGRCIVGALTENQIVKHDTNSILKNFKKFYSNLAGNLLAKLPKSPNRYTNKFASDYYKKLSLSENFKLDPATEGYLFNILKNVEVTKTAGIDQISGKLLKDGARILGKPVSELCNLSMTLGSFPAAYKIAKVKPPFKKGSKTDPSNYRPISLLSLLSKVFERVALNQTEEFLSLNKVLYDYQSGFRKNHSTGTCLSFLNDKILKGFDNGLVTGMILIDLQKAFDTINHDILLKKPCIVGFSDHTVKWFQSDLSNRKFTVTL